MAAKNLGELNAVPLRNDTSDEARAWDWQWTIQDRLPQGCGS